MQREIQPVFAHSRALMERLYDHLDVIKANEKVEACVANRCSKLEERSVKLRD